MNEPLLTAMVSTYASERFLAGCLDDLLQQTLGDRLEIVVVDAASPEREGEIVRAYQARHANIRYVRAATRESTSAAFDRATALARGRYLTTANTDDRHAPEFAAVLCGVLEQCPEFGLAWADAAIGTVANEPFPATTATRRFAWPAYTPATALSCCLFGAQPVWRRDLHARVGGWSEAYRIANDHDMFLRLALAGGAVHVDAVLGLFLQRADSNAGRDHAAEALADACAVLRHHRTTVDLDVVVPGARRAGALGTAAAWFEFGNLCALGPYTDAAQALDCYRQALALPLGRDERSAVQAAFANNSGCILLAGGCRDAAVRAFAAVPPGPLREHNTKWLAARGPRPALRELRFAGLDHEVVRASRRTRSAVVDAAGRVGFGAWREQRPWDVYEGPNGVPWSPPAVAVG